MDHELVLQNLGFAKLLAKSQARRFRWVDFDELQAAAVDGLIDAARRYKPAGGCFRTYATRRISGAMIDSLRKKHGSNRLKSRPPVPAGFAYDYKALDHRPSAEEELLGEETRRLLREALSALKPREREVVERHYFGGEKFDQIAKSMGFDKSWVSRIYHSALKTLRHKLR